MQDIHLLRQLSLPDRFETLFDKVGHDVARILVKPEKSTATALERIALAVNARGEGMFVPIYAESGTGKTTLAACLSTFFPSYFAPTITYTGEITYEALDGAVNAAIKLLKADDKRILPLNLDHRESNPPRPEELAAIKRFLRKPSLGSRCILLWPETSKDIAQEIADRYVQIAGKMPISLPVIVQGPSRETWCDIALSTLEISNNVASIADLGIDPRNYDPAQYRSIGDYMRGISTDFTNRLHELVSSNQKALSLVIVYVTASGVPGVLSELTSSTYFGLLDAHALLDATKDSVIGRWWRDHRGLLTQSILQLNAHVFCLPPAASISILRNNGDTDIQDFLAKLDVRKQGPKRMLEDIGRTDLGKFLLKQPRSSYETRGTPSSVATPSFELLSEEFGFTYGKDKRFNKTIGEALNAFSVENNVPFESVTFEQSLGFCPLIPDNALHYSQDVICVEYAWRTGDFLTSAKRSEIAQYALTKLKNYARELGWTKD